MCWWSTTAGEPIYANPRNTAAGTLRQKEPALTAKRRLSAFVYHLVSIEDVGSFATFLVGDGAKAITGNVEYIDGGYHVLG